MSIAIFTYSPNISTDGIQLIDFENPDCPVLISNKVYPKDINNNLNDALDIDAQNLIKPKFSSAMFVLL